jgi:hypothetical protein
MSDENKTTVPPELPSNPSTPTKSSTQRVSFEAEIERRIERAEKLLEQVRLSKNSNVTEVTEPTIKPPDTTTEGGGTIKKFLVEIGILGE